MKTSLNRRTSAVFAAFCRSACAQNSTPSTATSNDFMIGAMTGAQRLDLDLDLDVDLDRLNERQPHGVNQWLMTQRGAA
ncbi:MULTISPECIES: hypothetical protein [Burkholderiaceae]|uniref:hypothetical protein n=1 Tax=Burkholderiaceae TaxID=119060 RepID=UPI0012E0564A|nr:MULTISPECIES: hypothetical protein [Burkholderiaceae]